MIDEAAAIEKAREHTKMKGWAFGEPVAVVERRDWRGQPKCFEDETNAGGLGTKARFVIDARDGAILSAGFVSR